MTNEQKQNLLSYLGYYTGNIDGKWGEQSKNATRKFQIDFGGLDADGVVGSNTENALRHAVFYGMPEKKTESETPSFWDEIKHFKRSEFACKCGKYCNGFPAEPNAKLVKVAERVREHFGAPVIVSSGVRCKTHNANVGGVPNSRHTMGKAMDFRIVGKTAAQVLAFVQAQPEIAYSYAIDGNYVHMDVK